MVGPVSAGEICVRWGNCLKYLERGWNRKEGRGNKDFKNRGPAGSRGGCLKKGGWNPLSNYASSMVAIFNPNLGGGRLISPAPPLVGFPLITQKR